MQSTFMKQVGEIVRKKETVPQLMVGLGGVPMLGGEQRVLRNANTALLEENRPSTRMHPEDCALSQGRKGRKQPYARIIACWWDRQRH